MIRPFWRYYGGKWRMAPYYPTPKHRRIVEPFAGAAGYSCRYYWHDVLLVEKYPTIAGMWRYLIAVSPAEIRRIPEAEDVRALPDWVPVEARALVGFSMNSSASTPRRTLSAGRKKLRAMHRQFEGWTPALRERVAYQVTKIRHWRVIEGDYSLAANDEATWFIDPPYFLAGKHYVHGSSKLDYPALADWCRERVGQTIVCENDGATWLPFQPFMVAKAGPAKGASAEAVWFGERGVEQCP